MITADTITDEQIRELLNLASLSPDAFLVEYPLPNGMTRQGWRLAIVTDCSAALGMSDAASMSAEANYQINRLARAALARLFNAREIERQEAERERRKRDLADHNTEDS